MSGACRVIDRADDENEHESQEEDGGLLPCVERRQQIHPWYIVGTKLVGANSRQIAAGGMSHPKAAGERGSQ